MLRIHALGRMSVVGDAGELTGAIWSPTIGFTRVNYELGKLVSAARPTS